MTSQDNVQIMHAASEGAELGAVVEGVGLSDSEYRRKFEFPTRRNAGRERTVEMSVEDWGSPIGEDGLQRRNGLIYSDPNPDLTPYSWRGLKHAGVADKMLYTSPVIYAGARSISGTIAQATPAFRPAGGATDPTDLEKEVADFYTWNLCEGLGGGVRALWDLAAGHVFHGFVGAEHLTRFKDTPFGRRLVLAGLAPRLPRSVSYWIFHEEGPKRGQLAGLVQGSRWQAKHTIPIDRLTLWTHQQAWCGPEGFPLARPCYFAWTATQELLLGHAGVIHKWKYGVPKFRQVEKATPKYDTEARREIREGMVDYTSRLNGFLMAPYGFDFDVIFPASAAPDPSTMLEAYNKEVLLVFHSLWLLVDQGGAKLGVGEHAQAHRNSIEHYALDIIEQLCDDERPGGGILKKLARFNYPIPPGFRWPTPIAQGIKYRDVVEKLKAVMLLLQSHGIGWNEALDRWLLDELGAPPEVLLAAAKRDAEADTVENDDDTEIEE